MVRGCQWIINVRRTDLGEKTTAAQLMKNYRLCENHFEPFMINIAVGILKDLSCFSH